MIKPGLLWETLTRQREKKTASHKAMVFSKKTSVTRTKLWWDPDKGTVLTRFYIEMANMLPETGGKVTVLLKWQRAWLIGAYVLILLEGRIWKH